MQLCSGGNDAFGRFIMKSIALDVQKEFCDECSLALRRFVGHMDGVNSIDVEKGKIVVTFDDGRITEEDILKITRESIEKLGYTMSDE
jgi:copper chaperone CopZ